jgi:AcrR family transcriptional regulator
MTQLKGQAQRGAETRAAILDAAFAVFAVRGYRSSALAEIAEQVGLSPAGILYHFGSKEALLLAVIAERDRRAAELLAEFPVQEGLAALRNVARFAELSEQEPGVTALHAVLVVESYDTDSPIHTYFKERSRFVRRLVEGTLREARRRGEVRADLDCEAKACEFIAFLEGAAALWLLDRTVSLVSLYESYIDMFIEAVASPSST